MYYNTQEEFEYIQCSNCACLFLQAVPENMEKYYPDNYHCHHVSLQKRSLMDKIRTHRDREVLLGKKIGIGAFFNQFKPAPDLLKTLSFLKMNLNSRMIDIGCGSAALLIQLESMGFKNLSGIDPFLPDELLSRDTAIKFNKGSAYDVQDKYDVIILNHSFEHMTDHLLLLNHLKTILNPSGKICIRIPVVGGFAWKKYKQNWFQIDAPRHLIIHSEKSLRMLARQTGYEVYKAIYDSEIVQFTRSEIYSKGISSVQFLSDYSGDLSRFFSEKQLADWKTQTSVLNREGKGDQAAFFLRVSE